MAKYFTQASVATVEAFFNAVKLALDTVGVYSCVIDLPNNVMTIVWREGQTAMELHTNGHNFWCNMVGFTGSGQRAYVRFGVSALAASKLWIIAHYSSDGTEKTFCQLTCDVGSSNFRTIVFGELLRNVSSDIPMLFSSSTFTASTGLTTLYGLGDEYSHRNTAVHMWSSGVRANQGFVYNTRDNLLYGCGTASSDGYYPYGGYMSTYGFQFSFAEFGFGIQRLEHYTHVEISNSVSPTGAWRGSSRYFVGRLPFTNIDAGSITGGEILETNGKRFICFPALTNINSVVQVQDQSDSMYSWKIGFMTEITSA